MNSSLNPEPAKQFRRISLPVTILAVLAAAIGLSVGVGAYTFVYAKGASYFSNDASACANCHIMQEQFDAWRKSPHHAVAVCNDCHAPHDNFVHKYYVKAVNGYNHSLAFTTGWHDDNLTITDFNRRVTEHSCRYCHGDIVHAIDTPGERFEEMSCIRCHSDVGHW